MRQFGMYRKSNASGYISLLKKTFRFVIDRIDIGKIVEELLRERGIDLPRSRLFARSDVSPHLPSAPLNGLKRIVPVHRKEQHSYTLDSVADCSSVHTLIGCSGNVLP